MTANFIEVSRRWLGRLPPNWSALPLRAVLAQKVTDGPHETPEFISEGVPFLSVDGIQAGELVFETCRYISQRDHQRYARKVLPRRNDILLGKAASTGKIARVKTDLEFGIWSPLALLRPAPAVDPGFLEYGLKTSPSQAQVDVLCTSNTQQNISMADIPRIMLPLPPLPTQKAIADFLDRKTAAIDALIAGKKKLLDLLAEKRAALINQAVTKGLDPNVPMKDSGIPWIGEIPAHWEVVLVRLLARLESGHTPSRSKPEYWVADECNIPWFSLADVWQLRSGTRLYLGETKECISEVGMANSAARLLPAGTVVLSRTASVGFTGIMRRPMATTQDFANWICGPRLQPEYLCMSFRAMGPEFKRLKMGSTHQTIYMPDIRQLAIPVPPVHEQRSVARETLRRTKQVDETMRRITTQIQRLQEYRQALITAAVTGQLDIPEEDAAA